VTRVPQQNLLENAIRQTHSGEVCKLYGSHQCRFLSQLWIHTSHRIVIAGVDVCMIKTI